MRIHINSGIFLLKANVSAVFTHSIKHLVDLITIVQFLHTKWAAE